MRVERAQKVTGAMVQTRCGTSTEDVRIQNDRGQGHCIFGRACEMLARSMSLAYLRQARSNRYIQAISTTAFANNLLLGIHTTLPNMLTVWMTLAFLIV
jgi:hypothetical protein